MKNISKYYFPISYFICSIILSGCVSNFTPIIPEVHLLSTEPSEEMRTAFLGDVMISRSQTQIFDTVLVKQTTKAGGFLNGWITILPGEYIAKHLDGKWTYFLADTVLWNNGVVGDSPVQGGVRVSRESGEIQLFATPTAGPRAHAKFDSNPGFDFVEKPFLSRGGYLEELIYAGKTTGALSLNYRKTWGENSINPELQVISFNIEKDKFLEYKGARIEVIDYNSNRIQYKVYRNFSKQIN